MLGADARLVAIAWFVVMTSTIGVEAAQTDSGPHEETVKRALALLPEQPAKVLVVDVTRAARAVDAHPRKVEAFVRDGEDIVYLVAQGDTLRRGQKGAGVFDYVLATIIWHEMAHLAGAGEHDAQRKEEDLRGRTRAARRVDTGQGLSYLALLRKRR